MNVYLYIAENNPDAAYEICKKYGYFNINSMEELADSLKSIVAEQGQDSLEEILNIHPEKEVILEIFDKKKVIEEKPLEEIIQSIFDKNKPVEKEKDCGCMKNAIGDNLSSPANSKVEGLPSPVVNQTNTYILVGALIVSIAILSMKK
jgi:hypothetical protein